ncbi:hypothetical protein LQ567_23805 [Niabella pedocola]|uniref:Tetratricopeptide repeat protein n=1 Tax=Niabella pedocola TaxID=1752077 RepID=A0ABS8PXN5_9BACT|nr:hypothetical protein [Niabella pedocola]MCD2425829.1 hypothetical protein [Niabella pedocola]
MTDTLIRLIRSLSPAEKRQFKMGAKKQQQQKAYVILFDLIDRSDKTDWKYIKQQFQKHCPASSAESTATYLFQSVTDVLIQNKVKADEGFKLMYGIMKADLFRQRNLLDQSFTEVRALLPIAEKMQKLPLRYLLKRAELNYFSETNFEGINEKILIAKQQEARDLLKDLRHEQEHHSLYEILKHRLGNQLQKKTTGKKMVLDDLVLSELAIVNNKTQHHLESRKLHLLFQSFYFTRIGDYQSALKTFYVLNTLFEKNEPLRPNPPIDYYNTLDGILDSLKMIRHYDEMPYFIEKLYQLEQEHYPDYFRFLVKKTALLYELSHYAYLEQWEKAIDQIRNTPASGFSDFSLIHEKKQAELIFYASLAWFHMRNFKKALKYVNELLLQKTLDYTQPYYRVCRLFNIVLHYEMKDPEYLEYEIRSYKRFFKGKNALYPLEKYIFKIVTLAPSRNPRYKNQQLWVQLQPLRDAAGSIPEEALMMHYFDFMEWAVEKFR